MIDTRELLVFIHSGDEEETERAWIAAKLRFWLVPDECSCGHLAYKFGRPSAVKRAFSIAQDWMGGEARRRALGHKIKAAEGGGR